MKAVQGFSRQDLIILARTNLVRARLARQEAGIVREFDTLYGGAYSPARLADRLENLAKECRATARAALQAYEVENGKAFLAGEFVYPLKDNLDGREFPNWPTYLTQYDYHFFNGVDPER